MKKTLLIILITVCVLLIIALGWYWLLPASSVPVVDKIRDSLPFGSGEDINIPFNKDGVDDEKDSFPIEEDLRPTTNLFQITDSPIAGAVFFNSLETTIVRYVDRATGHIYNIDLATFKKTKITNKTLPKIYRAYFQSNGNKVLFQSLGINEEIENLSITLIPPKTNTSTSSSSSNLYSVTATILRGEIDDIVVGTGNSLFYTLKDVSSIVSSSFEGTGLKTLFQSPFTNWRIELLGTNLLLYTKADSTIDGYAYRLNIANGALSKILGPLNGLIAKPNSSGTRIAYSYSEDNHTRLFVKELTSLVSKEILPATLAEKCLWSSKNNSVLICGIPTNQIGLNEPNDWYSGITHFSDKIWRFDLNKETAKALVEPKKTFNLDLDVSNLSLSPDEDYLIFTDRNTLSLWALKLE